jgi:hypothetical protein
LLASVKISLLLQYSLSKHADLPNLPLVMDLAKTDEQRAILKLIPQQTRAGGFFAGRTIGLLRNGEQG